MKKRPTEIIFIFFIVIIGIMIASKTKIITDSLIELVITPLEFLHSIAVFFFIGILSVIRLS